jgi:putative DNA primase/helicase
MTGRTVTRPAGTGAGAASWQCLYGAHLAADPARALVDAMHAAGVGPHDPADVVADGLLHRYRVAGDRPGTRNGWVVLHLDGVPSGAFGSWKAGITSTWCAGERLTPVERAVLHRRIEAARAARDAERAREQAAAADRAARLWAKARPADPRHPYLLRKSIRPHGARQLGAQLVLPVTTLAGALASLQFIAADGAKTLLRGGRKRGCCIVVSDPPGPNRLLICEGWATGASLAEADPDARVLAAVDAGNLEPVARAARERWPGLPIVICGDNDASGVGQRYAHAAARAVGGEVLIPECADADWNDVLGAAV